MKLIVDIPIDKYEHIVYEDDGIDELREKIADSIPLKKWLSSFNTNSATECFTAVQRLKESVNDRLDEGNTR